MFDTSVPCTTICCQNYAVSTCEAAAYVTLILGVLLCLIVVIVIDEVLDRR
jgi:hypothetical protein